jgi:hypothetical protein
MMSLRNMSLNRIIRAGKEKKTAGTVKTGSQVFSTRLEVEPTRPSIRASKGIDGGGTPGQPSRVSEVLRTTTGTNSRHGVRRSGGVRTKSSIARTIA